MLDGMENTPPPNIEARFHAYAEKLSTDLSHADRVEPFQSYCMGLLLPVVLIYCDYY